MANDFITKLDDEQVYGLTLNQAVQKMRGPANTKIKLTIIRKGQDKPIDVSIMRDVICVKSVRFHNGYIRMGEKGGVGRSGSYEEWGGVLDRRFGSACLDKSESLAGRGGD